VTRILCHVGAFTGQRSTDLQIWIKASTFTTPNFPHSLHGRGSLSD